MCALLRTLRERGHRVALRTLARGVATGLRLGFRAAPIDEHIESLEMTDWMAANGRQALRAAFDVFGMRAPLEVEDLREAIAVESPDALIVDPNTWGAAPMDEPVHVVATFPCGVPDGLALPTNACAAEFVPHGRVLDRAVCAITHGGMGVTQKALARGVPVCVVPYGRDQFEVARRVEVSGCGTRAKAHTLTPSRLRTKTLQAMTMTEGARRVADGFAATGGVSYGADLVERQLLAM